MSACTGFLADRDQDFGTDQLADVEPDRTQGSAKGFAPDVGWLWPYWWNGLGWRSYVGQQAVRLAVQRSPSPPSPHRLGLLGDWLRVWGLRFHYITRKHKPDIESGEP
jgi:hypothetical protein